MFLKQLELYGFKSFGERIKIEFNPRLTAIVGPNGSGKSNIVDSVRWLLGDQSHKSLRVPSSEEVIFKGTDIGSPFNFSHVGMVIDLDDEGEFQLERKFYRTGENDYILNGKVVRLKDIRSLLSAKGFGLGTLSILSQGQIDAILSLVPSDRRIVLEEVAQISQFKENKTRILKKLDSTRDNLTRLDDILREVDSRLKELFEQAQMARTFLELDRQRNELEVNLVFKETERFVKNIRKNLEELQEREKELLSLKSESTSLDDEIAEGEKQKEILRGELESELALSRERSLKVEKARSSMDLSNSELVLWQDKRNTNSSLRRKLGSEIESIRKQVNSEHQKIDDSVSEKELTEQTLNELSEKNKGIEEEENSILSSIETRMTSLNKSRADIDITNGHLELLMERLTRASQYLEEGDTAFGEHMSEVERFRTRLSELTANIEELSASKHSIDYRKDETEQGARVIETERNKLESELAEKKDTLISLASELKILKDLERRFVGYQAGVKRLIEAKDQNQLQGVVGPVIDLVRVNKGFEKAIQAALASRGQYIVVEKFQDGLDALEYLKKTGGGRVTFIPLEDFESGDQVYNPVNIPESEGYYGRAIEKIEIDEKYNPVVSYLLRDTLIFSDLKSARNARKKYNLKQWIVTLDGDVHQPRGIFTGGSIDYRSEGPLVRRSQIDDLENQKQNDEISVSSLVDRLNSAKALHADHVQGIRKLGFESDTLRDQIVDKSREMQYLDEIIKNHEKEINELRGRREKIETEINSLSIEIQETKNRISQLEDELDYIAREAEDDEERKSKITQDRSLREDEINRLRIFISSKEQEINFLQSSSSDLESRLEDTDDELSSAIDELYEILAKEEDAQSRYIKLKYIYESECEKTDREALTESQIRIKIDKQRQELTAKRDNHSRINALIEETDARRESQSMRIAKMETELVALLGKVADMESVKSEFPDLLNTESEDFNRFLESEFIDSLPSRKSIVDELNEIQEKISRIGQVNVLAERDYENYRRRKDFLEGQKQDLVKGADELMNTLSEIEQESKKAFKEVFDQTKINFQQIFSEIFPEGKAELSLTDPNNILESGLDIRVKFPGKKDLDLLQFSGGERSIIAITFLFAVLKTKPPSFVILDEVEAALDDVNVENFIRLMRSFYDKFQFIVVTHNKLTMEYASDLWGVTMKKGGMSQVVSISLEDWMREHPEVNW
jgi:chromosome segregation protein